MSPEDRAYLFELRCKSKLGIVLTREESAFCRDMFTRYPKEYATTTYTPPKIDLSTCQRGDRVRLRDGRKGVYIESHDNWYKVKGIGNWHAWYSRTDGKVGKAVESCDIVAILGPSIIEQVRRWFDRRKHGA